VKEKKEIMSIKGLISVSFIFLAALGFAGCSKSAVQTREVVANKNSAQPGSQTKGLEDLIQEYTEDQGEIGQAAWEKMQQGGRDKLISNLLQLRDSHPTDHALQPKIAFLLCNLNYEYESNKQLIVSGLGSNSPFQGFQADQSQSLLSRLIERGDKQLLRELFAVAGKADGDLAEGLAETFSRELRNEPENS
jgi:hypothetical protein